MRVLSLKLVPNFWKLKLSMRRLLIYLSSSGFVQRLTKTPWLVFVFLACLLTIGFLLCSIEITNFGGQIPRNNIVFLKTHKCASSTIQNVLLRYGESHNLTFVLPTRMNYLGHPQPFSRIFVPYPTEKIDFNILAHHSRLNYQEMNLLMPEDTVFITIVRNPSDLMESLYQYYLLEDYYKVTLEEMVRNESLALRLMKNNRYYTRVGLNQMSFDLGLEPGDFFNAKVVKRFCHLLDEQFHLVMLAERVEESLILLMDLMRWTLDDIVSFRLNARKSLYKSKLTPTGLQRLRDLSLADEIIYDYFRRKFEERVENYGRSKMSRQLKRLREKQKEIYDSCVETVKDTDRDAIGSNDTISYFDKKYLVEYRLKKDAGLRCDRIFISELKFTEILRQKQDKLFAPYFHKYIQPETRKKESNRAKQKP